MTGNPGSIESEAPVAWGGPAEVLARLAGRWTIARRIAPQGSLTGEAVFAPAEAGWLDYREQGALRLENGITTAAARRYSYQALPAGFAVYFAGPQQGLFHAVTLAADRRSRLIGRARHLCGADLYLSTYFFLPDSRFAIRHRVRGPPRQRRRDQAPEIVERLRAAVPHQEQQEEAARQHRQTRSSRRHEVRSGNGLP